MAIMCSICGKKQSSFITDFSLSDELNDYRICSVCYDCIEDVLRCTEKQLSDNIIKSSQELQQRITTTDPLVVNYVQNILSNAQLVAEADIAKKQYEEALSLAEKEKLKNFPITTSFNFEGYDILSYHGVLTSEVVLGTGILSELGADIVDLLGSESVMMSQKLEYSKDCALQYITEKALELGCNAIISLSFNMTMFSRNLIGIIASGTGITMAKKSNSVAIEKVDLLERISCLKNNKDITEEDFQKLKSIIL